MSAPQDHPKKETSHHVRKARMLVSMLGADFAKSSQHPFFRDLAKTAIQPTEGRKLTKPEMSRALEKLVRHLAEPAKPPANRTPPRQTKPEAPPPVTPPQDDVYKQHPVLIAKHLMTLPAKERLSVMRSLPGRTARIVAAYSAELQKDG